MIWSGLKRVQKKVQKQLFPEASLEPRISLELRTSFFFWYDDQASLVSSVTYGCNMCRCWSIGIPSSSVYRDKSANPYRGFDSWEAITNWMAHYSGPKQATLRVHCSRARTKPIHERWDPILFAFKPAVDWIYFF